MMQIVNNIFLIFKSPNKEYSQNKCNLQTSCYTIGHKFCSNCINKLLDEDIEAKCPICRKDIDKIYFNFNNYLENK